MGTGQARWALAWLLAAALGGAQEPPASAAPAGSRQIQPRSWDRVQYLGGAIGVSAGIPSWRNTLTVSPGAIQLRLEGGRLIAIDPERVTSLYYAGSRAPRTGPATAAMMVAPPVGLMILFGSRSTSHHIGIEYTLPDGRSTGVLIQADKKNYTEILEALRAATKISGPAVALPKQDASPDSRQSADRSP